MTLTPAQAAALARIREGWVVVPKKLTEAMKNAVRAQGDNKEVAWAIAVWPDLLEAAAPEAASHDD